jgi:hypothetical protein
MHGIYIDALWPSARGNRSGIWQTEVIRERRNPSRRAVGRMEGWNAAFEENDEGAR